MDNLHANYFATLFPQNIWFRFEAKSSDDNVKVKREAVQSYMENKIKQSNFINTASDLLYDYIQYGNCFATVSWEENYQEKEDENLVVNYIGPRVVRISPVDICFNPTASTFEKSPKIIRSIKTLGEIKKMIEEDVDCIIVAAGMEGALATLVSTLVDIPIIGIPTSVGYGYGEKGIAALASMLQSCSLGLSVVNIDNGIAAGGIAANIANRVNKKIIS